MADRSCCIDLGIPLELNKSMRFLIQPFKPLCDGVWRETPPIYQLSSDTILTGVRLARCCGNIVDAEFAGTDVARTSRLASMCLELDKNANKTIHGQRGVNAHLIEEGASGKAGARRQLDLLHRRRQWPSPSPTTQRLGASPAASSFPSSSLSGPSRSGALWPRARPRRTAAPSLAMLRRMIGRGPSTAEP